MLIVYDSLTGNVRRFVEKLHKFSSVRIEDGLQIEEPFILVTYTTGLGFIPDLTQKFLETNAANMQGVASSGNKNFGNYYGLAADLIAEQYQIPIIHKFEFAGLPSDVDQFTKGVEGHEAYRTE